MATLNTNSSNANVKTSGYVNVTGGSSDDFNAGTIPNTTTSNTLNVNGNCSSGTLYYSGYDLGGTVSISCSPRMVKRVKANVHFTCQSCKKEYTGDDAYNHDWKCPDCGGPIAAGVEVKVVEEPEYQWYTWPNTTWTNYDYSVTVSNTAAPKKKNAYKCQECDAKFESDVEILPKYCPFCGADKLKLA
jgi:Zn finger protein HypA/HybF involved in hydrogenase expression